MRQLSPQNALLFEARSFVACTLSIKYSIMVAGERVPRIFKKTLVTNSDGSVAISQPLEALPEGELLSIHINIASTTLVRHGQCFVTVSLMDSTNFSANTSIWETMLAGYISNDNALTYPQSGVKGFLDSRGYQNTISVANPGAGNNFSYTVPDYKIIELIGFYCEIAVNATAVNRSLIIHAKNTAAVKKFSLTSSYVQSPSTDVYYEGRQFIDGTGSQSILPISYVGIPAGVLLYPGESLVSAVSNIQSGDTIVGIKLHTREWITSEIFSVSSQPGGSGGKGAS